MSNQDNINESIYEMDPIVFNGISWTYQDLFAVLQDNFPDKLFTMEDMENIVQKIERVFSNRLTQFGFQLLSDCVFEVVKE